MINLNLSLHVLNKWNGVFELGEQKHSLPRTAFFYVWFYLLKHSIENNTQGSLKAVRATFTSLCYETGLEVPQIEKIILFFMEAGLINKGMFIDKFTDYLSSYKKPRASSCCEYKECGDKSFCWVKLGVDKVYVCEEHFYLLKPKGDIEMELERRMGNG